MKKILKELVRNEKGQALIIVLCFLAIGGLTIATLLTYMSTGLKAGQVYEKKTNEFYAADAGVENTLWQLTSGNLTVPAGGNVTSVFTLNNKTVSVAIANEGNSVHRITSTATSADGSKTSIESYIEGISLFDNAITSNSDVTIRSGSTVDGDIQYGGTLVNNGGTITGDSTNEQYAKWPTSASLSAYYWEDVKALSPYPSAS